MKNFIISLFVIILITSKVSFGQNSKAELQLAVFYTQAAETSVGVNTIKSEINDQVVMINSILTASGISDYAVDKTSVTKLDTYKEPKHSNRSVANRYITYSFDGTIQALDELVNHEGLRDYHNAVITPNPSILQESQLEEEYIILDDKINPDVFIFIVDENGPPMISQEILHRYNSAAKYKEPLFALVSAEAFEEHSNALALVFFDLFALREDADEAITNTLLSFWRDDVDLVENRLSLKNKTNFQCNAGKLELGSSSNVEIVGKTINNKRTASEISGEVSVLIKPGLTHTLISTTTNTGDFILLSNKKHKPNSWSPTSVTCNASAARSVIADETSEPIAQLQPDQVISSPLTLYPNPFTNLFKVVYEQEENASDVVMARVYDLSGRVALEQQFNVGNSVSVALEIDGSSLSVGHYIIELIDGSGIPKRGRLIKEQ